MQRTPMIDTKHVLSKGACPSLPSPHTLSLRVSTLDHLHGTVNALSWLTLRPNAASSTHHLHLARQLAQASIHLCRYRGQQTPISKRCRSCSRGNCYEIQLSPCPSETPSSSPSRPPPAVSKTATSSAVPLPASSTRRHPCMWLSTS